MSTSVFAMSAHRRRHSALALGAVLALALVALIAPALGNPAGASTPAAARAPHRMSAELTASFARKMLTSMNTERRWHGLAPLRLNPRLMRSAHQHDLTMARDDTMSHQLPHEAFFATRISHAGYRWRSVGENIGWNSNLSLGGVYYLQNAMYHEKAPDNGHRLNILNRSYRQVGIDVYYDRAHDKIWFTQDFGQPA